MLETKGGQLAKDTQPMDRSEGFSCRDTRRHLSLTSVSVAFLLSLAKIQPEWSGIEPNNDDPAGLR